MAAVKDVHKELDNIEEVRERLRDHGKLIKAPDEDDDIEDEENHDEGVRATVASLAHNEAELMPFVHRIFATGGKQPKVCDIYTELLALYKPYSNCLQTEDELVSEMWEVRKHCVKLKELAMKLKTRRVTARLLVSKWGSVSKHVQNDSNNISLGAYHLQTCHTSDQLDFHIVCNHCSA